mmetsp:Transcript_9264/g.24982  ORF Transcript_9264/g.24982 Transcript_9264/m.24982 type:complete len:225 (-) Transcript_9264:1381-2055(-)
MGAGRALSTLPTTASQGGVRKEGWVFQGMLPGGGVHAHLWRGCRRQGDSWPSTGCTRCCSRRSWCASHTPCSCHPPLCAPLLPLVKRPPARLAATAPQEAATSNSPTARRHPCTTPAQAPEPLQPPPSQCAQPPLALCLEAPRPLLLQMVAPAPYAAQATRGVCGEEEETPQPCTQVAHPLAMEWPVEEVGSSNLGIVVGPLMSSSSSWQARGHASLRVCSRTW